MTRVVLISGKGGVGKTTVSAATGVRAAQAGRSVLVASLDRAHNLGDVLGVRLGAEPTAIPDVKGLFAMEADPQMELQRQWQSLSGYFARLLEWAGLGATEANEVSVFPGLEELLVLSKLTEIVESDSYDLVVVDLAPTASSLRLLSFPELMSGPIGRLFRWERSFMRIARPAARRVLSMPLPEEETYASIEAFAARLGRLRDLLTDPSRAVVRLVSIPERVVVDETRSAFTLFSLFGLAVDAVVFNRVLPPETAEGYFGAWTKVQARELARAREQFAATPMFELRFQPDEVIGVGPLSSVGEELFGRKDPSEPLVDAPPLRFRDEQGGTVLDIRLPHADRSALDLKQRDDELIVTVGGWRRRLPLPASLRGRAVRSAKFESGTLRVRFAPKEVDR